MRSRRHCFQGSERSRTPPKPARIVAHCLIRGREVSQGLELGNGIGRACGVTHGDRDINGAKNILAVGHGRPVVGSP